MPRIQPPRQRETELLVRSLGGLGDGIADMEGAAVYIPKTLPGDRIIARNFQRSGDGWRAEMQTLLEASPSRGIPPCAHYHECGGCTLQHLSDTDYTEFKMKRAQGAIAQAGYDPALLAPLVRMPHASRRRAEFRLVHGDSSVQPAYLGLRSHERIAITRCEVLSPTLHEALQSLAAAIAPLPSRAVLETVKLTLLDNGIDAVLTSKSAIPEPLRQSLKQLTLPTAIIRLSLLENETLSTLWEHETPLVHPGGFAVPVAPASFLQASVEAQLHLTREVVHMLEGATMIADLFAGLGIYGFALAASHPERRITAIEGEAAMTQATQEAIRTNRLEGRMQAKTRDLFKNPLTAAELNGFEGVAINPPRVGAKAQCEQLAGSKIQHIAMVSCNPATFARDAATLRQGGFRLVKAAPIDQFTWTAHLEILAQFKRN